MIRRRNLSSFIFMVVVFENGHGTTELYQPAHLVQNNDIIVITCNYRLGALGYLDWSYFNKDFHSNNWTFRSNQCHKMGASIY
ncbi:carboxylesterase family protein [Staphylococcus aureus]|uniref:carboxylesterase family protein n=1 Tax=Staphylococcus aureus TaxID=1280 RepID=UPI0021F1595C|nr:carboxylesterase family protein [Staphylococcus aureus]